MPLALGVICYFPAQMYDGYEGKYFGPEQGFQHLGKFLSKSSSSGMIGPSREKLYKVALVSDTVSVKPLQD